MDVFLGMIAAFGFNFPPRGWASCQGQILAISTNQTLFALLGTTYGGDGTTTFALPHLGGRTLVGQGRSPGVNNNYMLGEVGGTESTTLTTAQMPIHTHLLNSSGLSQAGSGSEIIGDTTTPTNSYLALSPKIGSGPNATQLKTYATALPAPVEPATTSVPSKLAGGEISAANNSIGPAGNSQPHLNMQPYMGMNYSIATQGIFPSRN